MAPSSPASARTARSAWSGFPGSTGGVTLLHAVGDRLRIAHTGTCDGGQPRAVLSLLDPAGKDEDVLIRLGRHRAWAQIRSWDELRPWGF